jgi:peptidylprolyl isomerase
MSKKALLLCGACIPIAAAVVLVVLTTVAADDKKDEKVVTTDSGLKYVELKVGDGTEAKEGSKVMVHYTGTLENGKKVDSSVDRGKPFGPITLGKGMVIKGWDEGLQGMKVGGKRKLIIPAKLGYGAGGTPDGTIPPNATLIFEVELLEVK